MEVVHTLAIEIEILRWRIINEGVVNVSSKTGGTFLTMWIQNDFLIVLRMSTCVNYRITRIVTYQHRVQRHRRQKEDI